MDFENTQFPDKSTDHHLDDPTETEPTPYSDGHEGARLLLDSYFGYQDPSKAYLTPAQRDLFPDPEQQKQIALNASNKLLEQISRQLVADSPSTEEVLLRVDSLIFVAQTLDPADQNPRLIDGLTDAFCDSESRDAVVQSALYWRQHILEGRSADAQQELADKYKVIVIQLNRPHGGVILTRNTQMAILETLPAVYDTAEAYIENGVDDSIVKAYVFESTSLSCEWADPNQSRVVTELFETAVRDGGEIAKSYFNIACRYALGHQLDINKAVAFGNNILPRIKNNDQIVAAVNRFDAYGRGKTFGTADFICHALTSEVTPSSLHELLTILHEIPTTSSARLNRNRKDALKLGDVFFRLRLAIHTQEPGIHDILTEMISYASTQDKEKLSAAMKKVRYTDFTTDLRESRVMFDPDSYSAIASNFEAGRDNDDTETILDVLRRLEKNTRPVDESPPNVLDPELNQLFSDVHGATPYELKDTIMATTSYLNQQLETMMTDKVVGIEPTLIDGLAWLEQQQYKALYNLDYESQIRLARQPWFVAILKFHDLTHNANYDSTEFDSFVETLQTQPDGSSFRLIAKRTLGEIQSLASDYGSRGRTDWVGTLWTGNTTHELIGLVDPREATTAIGRRLRNGTAR